MNWIRLAIVLALAALGLALLWLFPVADSFGRLLAWLRDLGPWGPGILVLIYVPACAAALPVWPLTMGGGLLFGLEVGFLAVMVGDTLGACAAFLVSRSLARQFVESRIRRHAKFAAIDHAVANEGFKLVFLLRLSPAIPYNILNYALGMTGISFSRYAFASFLGMMPGALMYVYLGTAVKNINDLFHGRTQGGALYYSLLAGGLVATILVTIYLARIATRALNAATSADPASPAQPQLP